MTDDCIALGDIAKRLSISIRGVHRLLATGELASIRIGRRRVVRASVLNAFLDQHTVCAG